MPYPHLVRNKLKEKKIEKSAFFERKSLTLTLKRFIMYTDRGNKEMKKTIIKFTKTDSTTVAEGKAKCDKCQKANLEAMFALVRKGEDFDVFEFENGIWNLCEECVKEYAETGKYIVKG